MPLFVLAAALAVTLCGVSGQSGPHWQRSEPTSDSEPQRNDSPIKIIGGDLANITEAPWTVSVHYGGDFICGGAVIRRDVVLTAAQCAHLRSASQLMVRAGSTSRSRGGVTAQVKGLLVHEAYDPVIFDNDLALLWLNRPLQAAEVPLQRAGLIQDIPDGAKLLVTGWGMTENGVMPNLMRKIYLTKMNREDCRDVYNSFVAGSDAVHNLMDHHPVTDRMFCARGSDRKGPCSGDTGDPVVANGHLVGLVSWSSGCALRESPTVFSNLAVLVDWVHHHINDN